MTTHRGCAPEDPTLFGEALRPRLRAAADEAIWLHSRGYSLDSAVAIVGGHHRLVTRQRLFLKRAVCSEAERARRAERLRPTLSGRVLHVDGFNLLITLEVALSGGLVFTGYDGALRDLAGLRGSYHLVDATDRAIDLALDAFERLSPERVELFLDEPVSNSGRLRACIEERAEGRPFETRAALDPNPDARLAGADDVVSADALVLDRCRSWLPIASSVVRTLDAFHLALWGA